MPVTPRRSLLALALLLAACRSAPRAGSMSGEPRWWKGNTHTHTLWSDGDDFPEMVAEWYKSAGYHFVALSDHNTLATGDRWWPVPAAGVGRAAYEKYHARHGAWVESRTAGDTTFVRLRRPAEYRPRLAEPGRFAFVDAEEITQYLDRRGAHVTALNLADVVPEQSGATLVDILRADLARLAEQTARAGRPVLGTLNHPNFLWSQTAEELVALPEARFFELYNGHPLVYVLGDSLHASNERIWDIVLTARAARGGAPLYGVATDDAHDYHRTGPEQRNSGRGWIMVRAPRLEPDTLMHAMARGDFYASTGVVIVDVRRIGGRLTIAIQGEPGVSYTTQFIGTRRGYDTTSVAVHDSAGRALTRRYSADVGAVLATSTSLTPAYVLRGDELYVRARIVSSRATPNAPYPGERETAWTQPVFP